MGKMFSKRKKTFQLNRDLTHGVIDDNTGFEISEAYKSARTNIMFALSGVHGCKQLLVTSAMPGEGKSTTCVNLAITFAQTGAKVIIIDADLRKPKIHRYIGVGNGAGLSNFLGGFAKLAECVHKGIEHGIDYITAGHVPPNPIELLASSNMKNLLQMLSNDYDYVIIDTPPIRIVSDAAIMAKLVGNVVLVARENYVTHPAIADTLEKFRFAQIAPIGFVLTASRRGGYFARRRKMSKYGKYKSAYGYGYGSSKRNAPYHNSKEADSHDEHNV